MRVTALQLFIDTVDSSMDAGRFETCSIESFQREGKTVQMICIYIAFAGKGWVRVQYLVR